MREQLLFVILWHHCRGMSRERERQMRKEIRHVRMRDGQTDEKGDQICNDERWTDSRTNDASMRDVWVTVGSFNGVVKG